MHDDTQSRKRTNRLNSQKSTGPRDTKQTRFNALKHGFASTGITDLDDRQKFARLLDVLKLEYGPRSTLEMFLVERIALGMVRLERASQLETQHIQSHLHPPQYGPSKIQEQLDELMLMSHRELLDPGSPAALSIQAVTDLCDTYSRYETTIENRLYRTVSQLERLQVQRRNP